MKLYRSVALVVLGTLISSAVSKNVSPLFGTNELLVGSGSPAETYLIKRDDDDDSNIDSGNPDEEEGEKEDSKDGLSNQVVKASYFSFNGKVRDYVYLKQNDHGNNDETILALTTQNTCYVTHDQGYSWEIVAPGEEILSIHVNPYNSDHVYLIAANQKVVYSRDRADNWKSFRTPSLPSPNTQPIRFHPRRDSWLIWLGQEGCTHPGSLSCRTVAYVSKSFGKRWLEMQENVNMCSFIVKLHENTFNPLVLCDRPATKSNNFRSELMYSEDFFKTREVVLTNVVDFETSGEYFFTTVEKGDSGVVEAYVSTNGKNWHKTSLPAGLELSKHQAYTIISATEYSVWMHITTNDRSSTEFGNILKSNSNGTYYNQIVSNVNRDLRGYVDFEKMEGIEGISVINTVLNPNEARAGARKKVKSQITHNDGGNWEYIHPPAIDSNGVKTPCYGNPLEKCSLNLHGYTERADYRDTFSSQGALGMMVATGNVGETLQSLYDGNTYLTRDGGITWKEVRKGVYMWEYGDQGSIIVLVNSLDQTNEILYSLNEGDTWETFRFSEEKVWVEDISTVPSDNSKKFLLFTKLAMRHGDRSRVFQIDFSTLYKRKCNLDVQNLESTTDDFEIWSPQHPLSPDNCLFGRETRYLRKIPGRDCFIGTQVVQPHSIVKDCACTRQDFECDFNYIRDKDDTCRLIAGYSPPNHLQDMCFDRKGNRNKDQVEYWVSTGYRKIPLSTCKGGFEMDKKEVKACPGSNARFNEMYGITKMGVFKAFVSMLGVVGISLVVGRYVVKNYGDKLRIFTGPIRLEDDEDDYRPSLLNAFTEDSNDSSTLGKVKQGAMTAFLTVVAVAQTSLRKTRLWTGNLKTDLQERFGRRERHIVLSEEEEVAGSPERIAESLESSSYHDIEEDRLLNETDVDDGDPSSADEGLHDDGSTSPYRY